MKKRLLSFFVSLLIGLTILPATHQRVDAVVISSVTDSRIEAMLSAIDLQNFSESNTTAAKAKEVIRHFLFDSTFAAIRGGRFSYPNDAPDWYYTIEDNAYKQSITGSKGCMAYSRFVSKCIYGIQGAVIGKKSHTADTLKMLLKTNGQAGDHIRISDKHSLTFISCNEKGFYAMEYNGNGIHLSYYTYSEFIKNYSGREIFLYDSNNSVNDISSNFGELDEVRGGSSDENAYVRVQGWVADQSNLNKNVTVDVYIGGLAGSNGAERHRIYANKARPDVNDKHGITGNHGFDAVLKTSKRGTQDVYVYALNLSQAGGGNQLLGEKKVTIPNPSATPPQTGGATISYSMHLQHLGWQPYVSNGATSGTSGLALSSEAIKIKLNNVQGDVVYKTHVQKAGWTDERMNDAVSGTTGQALRMEAIQISLRGDVSKEYDVYYKAHVSGYGWLAWVKNGATAGTVGEGRKLEAIQIELRAKTTATPTPAPTPTPTPTPAPTPPPAPTPTPTPTPPPPPPTPEPTPTPTPMPTPSISYSAHVQKQGWQPFVSDGEVAGTTGQGLRMEAIKIILSNAEGDVVYRTHLEKIGWTGWSTNGDISGTTGEARRMEAIQIYLRGDISKHYDVWYRAHVQKLGWLDWVCNGATAGTTGEARRLEAVQIELRPKK
ncbi:MAG: hypothetical protein FWH17_04755 [Oscillospiraceae bacterium]|nr:hypothetical protein [Oscillospiraceae bacterium]